MKELKPIKMLQIPKAENEPAFGKPRLFEQSLKFNPQKHIAYWRSLQNAFISWGPTKSNVSFIIDKPPAHPLVASINPHSWDASFCICESLEFKPSAQLAKFLEHYNIVDPIYETLLKCAIHEIGHWEFPRGGGFGCPYDYPTYYTSFIEPIHAMVESAGLPEKASESITYSLANAVTDIINNCNVYNELKKAKEHYAGQILFWYLQGQEKEKYPPDYALFVKLNLSLFGTQQDFELLEKFMPDDARVDEALNRLKLIFSEKNIYSSASWARLAAAYAKEVLPLISLNSSSCQYSASAGASSAGQSSRTKPFGSELSDDDKQAIMGGRKKGKGIPFYLNKTEALDAYYKHLARSIPIRARGEHPKASFPLIPTTFSPFDPQEHSLDDIVHGKLFFDPVLGKLTPAVGLNPMNFDIPVLKTAYGLPDCFFILLDCSASMTATKGNASIVPWGDESYYHYGVLTFYGLLRYFEKQGIKHRIKFGGAIFSNETIGASNLDELKIKILNPIEGGTTIDLEKVIELNKGRKNLLLPMISDGQIQNWPDIKEGFIEFVRKNQFFMIQIGLESKASRDLKAAGFQVYHVQAASDIVKLAIDLTAKTYDSVIAKKEEEEKRKYSAR